MIDNKTLDIKIAASVEKLTELFGAAPAVAVVLGSGWAGAVSLVEDARHLAYTDSVQAAMLLEDWATQQTFFKKVMRSGSLRSIHVFCFSS